MPRPAEALSPFTPLLMVGAGAMGGALLAGLRLAGAITPADLMIVDPRPGAEALRWIGEGAAASPDAARLASARGVVLAVKPQIWRDAAAGVGAALAPAAPVVSLMAGPLIADIGKVFAPRPVGRMMPNLAAAVGKGATAVFAPAGPAHDLARALAAAVGETIELGQEGLLHVATAVGGSGPAYLYAFTEALARAAVASGLAATEAERLARATVVGAAALLGESDDPPARLRERVTSPAGTTAAALATLGRDGGLGALLEGAVAAAAERSRELAR